MTISSLNGRYELKKSDQKAPPAVETFWVYKDGTLSYSVSRIYTCTCTGYLYTGHCKHIKLLQEEAFNGINKPMS